MAALRIQEGKIMSEKVDRRLDKIRERRKGKLQHEIADWQSVNPEAIVRAIAAISYNGGAVRFGYTRDGGAYAIGIYLGNDHFTEYVRPGEDIVGYLEGLVVDMGDL